MTDPQDALRKTIVARIATRDTSIKGTPEQVAETKRLLGAVLGTLPRGHADRPLMEKLLAALDEPQTAAVETAPEGGTAADAVGGGNVADKMKASALGAVQTGLEAVARAPVELARLALSGAPTAFKIAGEDAVRNTVNRLGRVTGGPGETVVPGRVITEADFKPAELKLMREMYDAGGDRRTANGGVAINSQHSGGIPKSYVAAIRRPDYAEPQGLAEKAMANAGLPVSGAAENLIETLGGFGMREDGGRVVARDTYDFKSGNVGNLLTSNSAPEASKSKFRIDLGPAAGLKGDLLRGSR